MKTGDKSDIGTYKCTIFGKLVRLDEHIVTLPPCPECKNTEYKPE